MRRNYTAAGWGGAGDHGAAAEGGSKGTATRAEWAVCMGKQGGAMEGRIVLRLLLLAARVYLSHHQPLL